MTTTREKRKRKRERELEREILSIMIDAELDGDTWGKKPGSQIDVLLYCWAYGYGAGADCLSDDPDHLCYTCALKVRAKELRVIRKENQE